MTLSASVSHQHITLAHDGLDDAFPEVKTPFMPTGWNVLVQIRRTKNKTRGGIILTEGVKDIEKWNTQIGKVVAMGGLAFRNRDTLAPWPEGAWAEIGDFVVIPKFGGFHRFQIDVPGDDEPALFALLEDRNIQAVVVGDPLAVKTFV